MASSLKEFLFTLDVFGSSADRNLPESVQNCRWNIIGTRFYFLLLFIILFALAAVSWSSTEVITVTIREPTKAVFENLPYDAQCPCSRSSVSYEDFTSMALVFHQVCSSDFVSDQWIETIFTGINSTFYYLHDFRRFGSGQFQALASFCRLSMAYIEHSISMFKRTTLISLNVLRESLLTQQTKAAIEQFISAATKEFAAQLFLIQQMTVANNLVSGLLTSHGFQYNVYETQLRSVGHFSRTIMQDDRSNCNCGMSAYCKAQAVFDEIFGAANDEYYRKSIILPGISSGCLPVSSILASTLECFYNQTCVNLILSFFPTTAQFLAMEPSQPSRYRPTSTVQSMVDYLMLEHWTADISYDKYFTQCAPASCAYSQVKRKGVIFALLKVISSLAILSLILGIIMAKVMDMIRSWMNPRPSPKISISERLEIMKTAIVKFILELNVFHNEHSVNQPIRQQLYATRFYIFLLISTLIILSGYTLLSQSVYSQTLFNPSESQYLQLEQEYLNTLSCPCKSMNMSYSVFITSEPYYHQLCSSTLMTSQWLQYALSGFQDASFLHDYRFHSGIQSHTLALLCEFARRTIDDARDTFLRTELIGSQVIPKKLFETQMYSLIKEWNSTTLNKFVRAIQLIQNTTQSNQLLNRLNIYLFPKNNPYMVLISPRDYEACSCVFSRTCGINMGIYTYDSIRNNLTIIERIPNFFVGCYLVDALFMSTLECFYNESCMTHLDQYFNSSLRQTISFPILNATLNRPTEKIGSIVNRLMLDSWQSNVNFSSYYRVCGPIACTFEYKGRNDLFSAITTILGVFGGLSLGYKLIILIGLQMIEKLLNGLTTAALTQMRRHLFGFDNEQKKIYRLHILLVIITLTSLYSSITFSPKVVTVEIERPSFSDYQELIIRYDGAVHCSCSRISIKYQSFLDLGARFHPVCNDDFLSRYSIFAWVNGPLIYSMTSRDYVYSGHGQVSATISSCDLSQQVVTDSFRQLLSSDFISAQLLPADVFDQRMRKMIDDFLTTLPKSTINALSLIRQTTSANMIMNTLSNNWIFTADNVYDSWSARTKPVAYEGCYCGLSAQCTDRVNEVVYGCYVIEAFMQTTLEAFYDSRRAGLNLTFPALNVTANPTRFGITGSVELILNELMVEEFSKNISYAQYFEQCAPSLCIASYIERSHLVEGITILVSLYGGLVIICRGMAMIIVKLLQRQQNTIHPIVQ